MALPQKRNNNDESFKNKLPSFSNEKEAVIEEVKETTELSLEKQLPIDDIIEKRAVRYIPVNEYAIRGHEESPFIDEPDENGKINDDDKYIDTKEMKIVPLGGKKVKAKDFDDRKNTLSILKIFRIGLVILFLILFGFGIKNTFFPSNNFSQDEITNIALTAVGETGFPVEKGKAFAEEYLKYYLNLDKDDENNRKFLSKFSSGVMGEPAEEFNRQDTTETGNKQRVLSGPYVFETINISEKTAQFKLSALVSDESGNVNTTDSSQSHWVSFSINLYHNPKSGKLAIQGEPSLIPTYEIEDSNKLPEAKPLGVDTLSDTDIIDKIYPVVSGYLKAYAISSYSNNNDILQYIPTKYDKDLVSGFDNKFSLQGEESDYFADIRYFITEEANTYKVSIVVNWKDNYSGIIYPARYVLTVTKQGSKYLITKISPFAYIPEDSQS